MMLWECLTNFVLLLAIYYYLNYLIPQNSVHSGDAKVGFSKAMSSKWITMAKNADGEQMIFRKVGIFFDILSL